MSEIYRAFIAIELPGKSIREIADLQDNLKSSGLRMRWAATGNIHLTLRFLGDIPVSDTPKIEAVMKNAANGCRSFSLAAKGIGVFPGLRKPRVLWVGLGGDTSSLEQIYNRLNDELDGIGYEKEKRPFHAHLTLARAKGALDARKISDLIRQYGDFSASLFKVDAVTLFKSVLKPSGAVYMKMCQVKLDD